MSRLADATLRRRPALVLEAALLWLVLLWVDARLALLPYRWNRGWLFDADETPPRPPSDEALARARAMARLLRSVARFRIRTSSPCLCLALALRARLRSIGSRPVLVYGARRRAGRGGIDAHAWLELGTARIEVARGEAGFRRFDR